MLSPFSIAFLARSPAPIITLGLEVLVQLVIAAITIEPSFSTVFLLSLFLDIFDISVEMTFLTSLKRILSSGRFGPDIQGSTSDKFKCNSWENLISLFGSLNKPTSLQ